MTGGERRQVILHRLRAATRVTVAELVDATAASEMTIRRDLDVLAAQGRLRRVHGGAVLLRQTEPASFDTRLALAAEAKQAIGATTASLIADGETVVLDRGTTALAVARHLRDRPVTVMPLSLHAAFALMDGTRARVLLPGGQPSLPELALAGPLAVASLRSLRFDVAVLGASAFSAGSGSPRPTSPTRRRNSRRSPSRAVRSSRSTGPSGAARPWSASAHRTNSTSSSPTVPRRKPNETSSPLPAYVYCWRRSGAVRPLRTRRAPRPAGRPRQPDQGIRSVPRRRRRRVRSR
jgi:DeoR/GlpR family transcriptional regulator of sugar metabolism